VEYLKAYIDPTDTAQRHDLAASRQIIPEASIFINQTNHQLINIVIYNLEKLTFLFDSSLNKR
jgi:hypothetical protein